MKIISINKVDDCLEATNVRDFYFSRKITKPFIDYLSTLGKFLYADGFDKPFFKVMVRGKYTVKGALGNKIIRVLLPDNGGDKFIEELKQYIEYFN